MAGKSKKDEKGRDEMTDMAWRYWRQKSPFLPGVPSPGTNNLRIDKMHKKMKMQKN